MLYIPLKSNIYLSGMSCISCKEIAFLTIINLKNAPGPHWDLTVLPPLPPPTPQLFWPRFTPFARASSLRSEGLPRFLLISVLMPVLCLFLLKRIHIMSLLDMWISWINTCKDFLNHACALHNLLFLKICAEECDCWSLTCGIK